MLDHVRDAGCPRTRASPPYWRQMLDLVDDHQRTGRPWGEKGRKRGRGAIHGAFRDRKSWQELKSEKEARLGYEDQPYCIIVCGWQGGIALGARLQLLVVPTIIIESNARAGDSWRKLYKSLCLHDPVWYDHLPYLPFPDDWPVYTPKDKLGDWLESFVNIMELNYWTSSVCTSANYGKASEE